MLMVRASCKCGTLDTPPTQDGFETQGILRWSLSAVSSVTHGWMQKSIARGFSGGLTKLERWHRKILFFLWATVEAMQKYWIFQVLRVEFLPPKSAHKYEPLDLGIIANAKIRYRTILLRAIIDNTIRWNIGEHDFPLNSQNGRWGANKGYFPHGADAMTIFNKASSKQIHLEK